MTEFIICYLIIGLIVTSITISYDEELQEHVSFKTMALDILLWLPIVFNRFYKFIKG